jgi:nucleoside phosphorylase
MIFHYGIIASGNQVMRNGLKKDEISKKLGGVLCFEMEALRLSIRKL